MPHHPDYNPWLPAQYFGSGGPVAPATNPNGREEIAVDQPPGGGMDYPFVFPSSEIQQLLGDFWLSYFDPDRDLEVPFRIRWLYGFGEQVVPKPPNVPHPVHSHDLIVEDSNGDTVFDTTQATSFHRNVWGGRLLILQWFDEKQVIRLSKYLAWPSYVTPKQFDSHILPARSQLDGRTYSHHPDHVRSLSIRTHGSGSERLDGSMIELDGGFNIRLAQEEPTSTPGGRRRTQVNIRARPGDGAGRVDGCEDEADPVIRQISGVAPNQYGDFLLDVPGCYRAQEPHSISNGILSFEDPVGLDLFNDCTPCCECDDYVRTYKGLQQLWKRYLETGCRAEETRDLHRANRERWHSYLACIRGNPGAATAQFEGHCRAGLGGQYTNVTTCCLEPFTFRLTGDLTPSGAGPRNPQISTVDTRRSAANGGWIQGDPSGTWPVYDIAFPGLNPEATARVMTRIVTNGCQSGDVLRLWLTAHAPDPAGCSLPAATIPAALQNIWNVQGSPPNPTRMVQETQVTIAPGDL